MLLLDEPSLGLAPKIVETLFETLARIRDHGVTILLVEQRGVMTIEFADRTHVISNAELRLTLTNATTPATSDELTAPPDATPTSRELFLQAVIDGIGLGAVYAVVAVGIGLVFGVMRLVNLAYGELITAGAYTLAFLSGQPAVLAIVACFAVVIAGSLVMERVAFRPLRGASPATMLVASFAISFLLQNVYLLSFGSRGNTVGTLGGLNTAIAIGTLRIRWIAIVAIVVGAALLAGADAVPEPDDGRPASPRLRRRLPHRAAARRPREPGDRLLVRDLGRARRGRGGAAHRPVAARHARLRRPGDDLRADRRRRRRARPAHHGDGWAGS